MAGSTPPVKLGTEPHPVSSRVWRFSCVALVTIVAVGIPSKLGYDYFDVLCSVADSVFRTLCDSPAVAVALLGLCVYPGARATGFVGRFTFTTVTASGNDGAGRANAPPAAIVITATASWSDRSSGGAGCSSHSIDTQHELQQDDAENLSSRGEQWRRRMGWRRQPRRVLSVIRNLPRVSVELSPLPKITFNFIKRSGLSARSLLTRTQRWAPRMAKVVSCGDLQDDDVAATAAASASASGSCGSAAGGLYEQGAACVTGCSSGADEAAALVGTVRLPERLRLVEQVITDTHLLQFGTLLGDAACRDALLSSALPPPVGHADSLYGLHDSAEFHAGWEAIMQHSADGLGYWAWKRPLRRGINMYFTKTVLEGVSPAALRTFLMDDAYRKQWDDNMLELHMLQPDTPDGLGSGILYAKCKFPKPMASREYVYARRVWPRPSDGGCYSVSRCCSHPDAPVGQMRGVLVDDYMSGCVIRECRTASGASAAEFALIYYEDSQVRPGIVNMAVKKGLWPAAQRLQAALAKHVASTGPVRSSDDDLSSVGLGVACHGDDASADGRLCRTYSGSSSSCGSSCSAAAAAAIAARTAAAAGAGLLGQRGAAAPPAGGRLVRLLRGWLGIEAQLITAAGPLLWRAYAATLSQLLRVLMQLFSWACTPFAALRAAGSYSHALWRRRRQRSPSSSGVPSPRCKQHNGSSYSRRGGGAGIWGLRSASATASAGHPLSPVPLAAGGQRGSSFSGVVLSGNGSEPLALTQEVIQRHFMSLGPADNRILCRANSDAGSSCPCYRCYRSVGAADPSPPSQCSSRHSSRRSTGGRKRRIVAKLLQAAGAKLAHSLLTVMATHREGIEGL